MINMAGYASIYYNQRGESEHIHCIDLIADGSGYKGTVKIAGDTPTNQEIEDVFWKVYPKLMERLEGKPRHYITTYEYIDKSVTEKLATKIEYAAWYRKERKQRSEKKTRGV